jgi:hypothetical protein
MIVSKMKNTMKLLILTLIVLGMCVNIDTSTPTQAKVRAFGDNPVVLIDAAHINTFEKPANTKLIAQLMAWGYDVIVVGDDSTTDSGSITSTLLAEADILLLLPCSLGNRSIAEFSVISDWFATPNKCIWVTGDSNFASSNTQNINGNAVLEAVNSSIFLETGTVADSKCNIGKADYRPKAVHFNTSSPLTTGFDHSGQYLPLLNTTAGTNNMDGLLLHGPTAVIGYNGTDYIPLENETAFPKPANVQIIAQFNETAVYTSNTAPVGYEAHELDTSDAFVAVAIQEFAGQNATGKIMVSGETVWSAYKGMFGWNGSLYIEEKKNHCDNWFLTNNTMEWFAPRGVANSGMLKHFVSITQTVTVTETETSINNVTATTNVIATATTTVTTTKSDSDGFGMIIGITSIVALTVVMSLRRRK